MEKAQQGFQAALQLKQQGNDHYKAGELREALRAYHQGHLHLKSLNLGFSPASLFGAADPGTAVPAELTQAINKLLVDLKNNMAAIFLKQKKFERCEALATEVIQLDATNHKSLLRRAKCRLLQNRLAAAERDVKQALTSYPKDAELLRLQAAIDKKQAALDKKQTDDLKGWADRL
eukprot:m.209365 g.209365  ORF g.209365 m.209365 type:complete len:176 (+) comp18544_c0_seq19:2819-3346(+)